MSYCSHCGHVLIKDAKFCSECGTHINLKSKIRGLGRRLKFKAERTVENIKNSLDQQISGYLSQLNSNQKVRIAGVTVPNHRRSGVKNALLSFQQRYLEGDPLGTANYEEWMEDLPKRLEEHNCIVCFAQWDITQETDIVVCPHCSSGGHQSHLANWIKSKNYCPLCRETVEFSEFIKLEN